MQNYKRKFKEASDSDLKVNAIIKKFVNQLDDEIRSNTAEDVYAVILADAILRLHLNFEDIKKATEEEIKNNKDNYR